HQPATFIKRSAPGEPGDAVLVDERAIAPAARTRSLGARVVGVVEEQVEPGPGGRGAEGVDAGGEQGLAAEADGAAREGPALSGRRLGLPAVVVVRGRVHEAAQHLVALTRAEVVGVA